MSLEQQTTPDNLIETIVPLLDLTSLGSDDTQADIDKLCLRAKQPVTGLSVYVAAVCIYPQFIEQAKPLLEDTSIKVATVANFPDGNQTIASVLQEIEFAKTADADEIDIVVPYYSYLEGKDEPVQAFLQEVVAACQNTLVLKVILETSALASEDLIKKASEHAIEAGVNFIKTSTGKHKNGGASLAAATTMLTCIQQSQKPIGIKLAGGVSSLHDANNYWLLASNLMSPEWISADTFRIGTSRLLDELG